MKHSSRRYKQVMIDHPPDERTAHRRVIASVGSAIERPKDAHQRDERRKDAGQSRVGPRIAGPMIGGPRAIVLERVGLKIAGPNRADRRIAAPKIAGHVKLGLATDRKVLVRKPADWVVASVGAVALEAATAALHRVLLRPRDRWAVRRWEGRGAIRWTSESIVWNANSTRFWMSCAISSASVLQRRRSFSAVVAVRAPSAWPVGRRIRQ
jgi:hypothetical protein